MKNTIKESLKWYHKDFKEFYLEKAELKLSEIHPKEIFRIRLNALRSSYSDFLEENTYDDDYREKHFMGRNGLIYKMYSYISFKISEEESNLKIEQFFKISYTKYKKELYAYINN